MKINITLKLLLLLFLMSCSAGTDPWDYDEKFTFGLILSGSGYHHGLVPDSVASVDVVQIYSLKGLEKKKNHVLPLNVLKCQPLIAELRKKEDISSFFKSLQKTADYPYPDWTEGRLVDRMQEAFHIIAFDHTMLRIGYIRYYVYSVKGVKHGMFFTLADEGVFYNLEPLFPLGKLGTAENRDEENRK